MLDLRQKMDTAVILITHDMGVVAETADNILVLYAGKVVEYGSVKEIFNTPNIRIQRTLKLHTAFGRGCGGTEHHRGNGARTRADAGRMPFQPQMPLCG